MLVTARYAHSCRKMAALETAIRSLGINMTIKHENQKLHVTSMNGPDCEKLMANPSIWLSSMLPKKAKTSKKLTDSEKARRKLRRENRRATTKLLSAYRKNDTLSSQSEN